MNKPILIFSIVAAVGITTALGTMKLGNTETGCIKRTVVTSSLASVVDNAVESDFLLDVSSRFIATITKEQIDQAKTLADLVPARGMEERSSFRNVRIIVHPEEDGSYEYGDSEVLNPAQKALLQSTDYSNTFNIEAHCTRTSAETGQVEQQSWGFHVSIVPEKEAEFKEGREALLNYIKESTQEATSNIKRDQLKPGRVYFTIAKDGSVSNVNLESTSGFASIDDSMMELMNNMSDKWHPATNSKGETVEQELVLFFGIMGC